MGGTQRGAVNRELRNTILEIKLGTEAATETAEPFKLEYHEDGYPKLPACLDRRGPHEEQRLEAA
jgi:hypothetical protein